jgi:hypothetical protein
MLNLVVHIVTTGFIDSSVYGVAKYFVELSYTLEVNAFNIVKDLLSGMCHSRMLYRNIPSPFSKHNVEGGC